MKVLTRKIDCLFLILLVQVALCFNNPVSADLPVYSSLSDQKYNLPFDQFFLHYTLKGKKDSLTLSNIGLNISYTPLTGNSSNSYDYQQKMAISSNLLLFIGERQENATFLINSSNRLMNLIRTEGAYIDWLIHHVTAYNKTLGAKNWDPFWIIPNEINETYPIYSYYLNLTLKTELGPQDLILFNTTRPVLVFNGKQYVNTYYENITNTINLVYDNYTGILIKGAVNTITIGSESHNYYANFELDKTNGFEAFPPYPSSTMTTSFDIIPPQLQRPNYLFLFLILALPIFITTYRFFRLKEISGGT